MDDAQIAAEKLIKSLSGAALTITSPRPSCHSLLRQRRPPRWPGARSRHSSISRPRQASSESSAVLTNKIGELNEIRN